jgi:hypothetical protein
MQTVRAAVDATHGMESFDLMSAKSTVRFRSWAPPKRAAIVGGLPVHSAPSLVRRRGYRRTGADQSAHRRGPAVRRRSLVCRRRPAVSLDP